MSQARSADSDPIMEEVRRNREALSARFGHDMTRLVRHLNEQSGKGGRRVVSLPPRRPVVSPPAA
jgi:hypothetical protein